MAAKHATMSSRSIVVGLAMESSEVEFHCQSTDARIR
jgi:hypothetical protein